MRTEERTTLRTRADFSRYCVRLCFLLSTRAALDFGFSRAFGSRYARSLLLEEHRGTPISSRSRSFAVVFGARSSGPEEYFGEQCSAFLAASQAQRLCNDALQGRRSIPPGQFAGAGAGERAGICCQSEDASLYSAFSRGVA